MYVVISAIISGFRCPNCGYVGYYDHVAVYVVVQVLVGSIASIVAVGLTRILWPCFEKSE